MIRIDPIWPAVEPMDMRVGAETALARVVKVFGATQPHHAYLFANRRANRLKVLVHDGIGVWLAARRPIQIGHSPSLRLQPQALGRAHALLKDGQMPMDDNYIEL
jgi:hypothetical protein